LNAASVCLLCVLCGCLSTLSFFFSFMIPPPPISTLFPYTTLFRSYLFHHCGEPTGRTGFVAQSRVPCALFLRDRRLCFVVVGDNGRRTFERVIGVFVPLFGG